MRQLAPLGFLPGHRRLAVAFLCALAGCLNPRPEEIPSENIEPGAAATGPADPGTPDFNTTLAPGADSSVPSKPTTADEPPNGERTPDSLVPPIPPDAGAGDAGASDAGVGDAGAPAIED